MTNLNIQYEYHQDPGVYELGHEFLIT